jgi:hypothetical protein
MNSVSLLADGFSLLYPKFSPSLLADGFSLSLLPDEYFQSSIS